MLSIDQIVNVTVNLATAPAVDEGGCNVGLIIGDGEAIPAGERLRAYASAAALLQDGFAATDAEYRAAALYFAQSPAPLRLYVARKREDESYAEALVACKNKNVSFYGVYACNAGVEEVPSLAASAAGYGDLVLFFDSADPACLQPGGDDVFSRVGAAYKGACVGLYNASDCAGAALMGLAMGLADETDDSAFDLFLKPLAGVDPEGMTEAEIALITGKGGNVYVQRGQSLHMVQPGACMDGTAYDERMLMVLLQKRLRQAVVEQMSSARRIPLTDEGVSVLIAAVSDTMDRFCRMGYIAPGNWTAGKYRTLNTGDLLPQGYRIYCDGAASLSAADRAARVAPPIYVAAVLAGCVRSVVLGVKLVQ